MVLLVDENETFIKKFSLGVVIFLQINVQSEGREVLLKELLGGKQIEIFQSSDQHTYMKKKTESSKGNFKIICIVKARANLKSDRSGNKRP